MKLRTSTINSDHAQRRKVRRSPDGSAHLPAPQKLRDNQHLPVLSWVLWCLQWCYTVFRILPIRRPVSANLHRFAPRNTSPVGKNGGRAAFAARRKRCWLRDAALPVCAQSLSLRFRDRFCDDDTSNCHASTADLRRFPPAIGEQKVTTKIDGPVCRVPTVKCHDVHRLAYASAVSSVIRRLACYGLFAFATTITVGKVAQHVFDIQCAANGNVNCDGGIPTDHDNDDDQPEPVLGHAAGLLSY